MKVSNINEQNQETGLIHFDSFSERVPPPPYTILFLNPDEDDHAICRHAHLIPLLYYKSSSKSDHIVVFKSATLFWCFYPKSYVARWWCDSFRVRYTIIFCCELFACSKFSEDPLTGKRSFRFNVQADVVFYPAAAVFGNSSFLSPTLHKQPHSMTKLTFLYNERFKGDRKPGNESWNELVTHMEKHSPPKNAMLYCCYTLRNIRTYIISAHSYSLTREGILSSHIAFIHSYKHLLLHSLKSIEWCLIHS